MSNVRKVLIVGHGGAAIEVAKKALTEMGMDHIILEPLEAKDLEVEYPEPRIAPPDLNKALGVYKYLSEKKGSKYHK